MVVTIAAVVFGGWRALIAQRQFTEKEVGALKVGMSGLEVRWRVGGPHYIENTSKITMWRYNLEDTLEYVNLVFEDSRVTQIERRFHWPAHGR